MLPGRLEFVLTKDKKVDIVANQIIEMLLLDIENGKIFSFFFQSVDY